jgi:TonB family protein
VVQTTVIENPPEGDDSPPLGIGGAEDESLDPGLEDRACAHEARFKRHIKRRPRQAVIFDNGRGGADGKNLRMGRGVAERNGTVVCPCEESIVPDDHRPDRHLPGLTGAHRLHKGSLHPFFIDLRICFHYLPLTFPSNSAIIYLVFHNGGFVNPMTVKKFIIPFILASLAGHALVIFLTARIDSRDGPRPVKVMNVELKTAAEVEAPPSAARGRQAEQTAHGETSAGYREDAVQLQNPGGPYESYLLQIRRRIEGLWSYPAQALSQKQEGEAVIRFTIDASGTLNDYYVTSTSGSQVLDEGALAVVRAASPFAPLPADFKLSRLHVTATFRYRMAN